MLSVYPRIKVYVCPILPTKDAGKIRRVHLMNEGISRLSHKSYNNCLMENYYDLFVENGDTLSPRLGRHYQGAPNERDDVHLDSA